MKYYITKRHLTQVIAEETRAFLSENNSLAAFNLPNDGTMPPTPEEQKGKGTELTSSSGIADANGIPADANVNMAPPSEILKALRAFMRDGEQLHPEAYANHMEAYPGEALMDIVGYYDDMNLTDKANALRQSVVDIEKLKQEGDQENFKQRAQALLDELETDMLGQNLDNNPRAEDIDESIKRKSKKRMIKIKKGKKLGKSRSL